MQKIIKFLSCRINTKETIIISILIAIYLLLLYYFSSFKFHYQEDEFITAYISLFLPPLSKLNWFALYPLDKSWVTQFPVLFFILQKPFLKILGPSLESIRISTWPYQISTVVLLYLIGKEYFKEKKYQILVPLIFIFLAPNLYLSSMGLHFISSTVLFLASFYFFLIILKKGRLFYAVSCGVFIGLSYLTYASSYITLPIIFLFMGLESIKSRTLKYFKPFIVSLVIALLILCPFIIYAISKDNFITQRVDQVSILNAAETQEKIKNGTSFLTIFVNSALINFKSLFIGDLGGINEYYFGREALFNIFTFFLIITGSITCLIKALKGKLLYLYPLIIFLTSFFLGMVITIPSGAFHRIYISFPFLAIIIVLGAKFIIQRIKPSQFKNLVLILIIFVFLVSNINSAYEMILRDQQISILTDSIYLESFIKTDFKEGKIFISTYPAHHLGKELFFRTNSHYNITSNYFPEVFSLVDKKSLLILHYPDKSQIQQLYQKFPNGKYLTQLMQYRLKYYAVFIPK